MQNDFRRDAERIRRPAFHCVDGLMRLDADMQKIARYA